MSYSYTVIHIYMSAGFKLTFILIHYTEDNEVFMSSVSRGGKMGVESAR